MMKFFRKHNKKLLAIFMALLMVVFIGGSALESLLTTQVNVEVATSNFGPITNLEVMHVEKKTRLLGATGLPWNRPLAGVTKPLEVMDWLLLVKEAAMLGVKPNLTEVRAAANSDALFGQVDFLARQLGVKPKAFEQAIAEFQAVQNTALAIASAALPSDAELNSAARDALEQVKIRAVLLPAGPFIDPYEEFGQEEIQSQFDKYRAQQQSEGLNFGYYRSPTLKAQFIRIDRDEIMGSVGVANLDRKARSFYEENRTRNPLFRRKPEEIPPPDPAASGLIVGPPAPEVSPFLEWDEAKDISANAVKKNLADQAAEQLANWVVQFATESWLDVPRGEDGYKTAPPEVATLEYYDRLLERLPPSLSYPSAVSTAETVFFSSGQADSVKELGTAVFQPSQGASQSFRALAFRSQPIVPALPKEGESDINPADFLALYQTCAYPLRDPETGVYYVFRIVDAQPGREADSVDECRDEVVEDLRLLRGFERARRRAQSLQQCAAGESLQGAYEADAELVDFRSSGESSEAGFFEPAPFSRVPRYLASRGRPAEGVFVGVGIGNLPNDVVDGCFALEDADQKSAVFELADRAAILLVEWLETIRPNEDDFNQLKETLVTQLGEVRWREAASQWLSPDHVRARTGFAPLTGQ